ncbi:MAG TPA: hypothetical protein VH560_11325, partial [Polyangia bacterium]|nr:hypothetical protein [Polyangia bacterium]
QKPLAIVVIGGALILAIIPRLLQPPLLVLAHRKEKRWANRPKIEQQRDEELAERTSAVLPATPEG